MRKILLLSTLFVGFCFTQGIAQVCTPLPIPLAGIYPNPLIDSNLPAGEVGSSYSTTISVIVAGDTTIDLSPIIGFPVPPVMANIAGQRINSIDALPPGMSYACFPSSCDIMADSAGCVAISGTPTTAGSYQPVMDTEIGIIVPAATPVIGGDTIFIPIPGLTYDLEVTDPTVAIDDINANSIALLEQGPNPFHTYTNIHYSAPRPGTVSFQVRDLTGKVMYQNASRAIAGENTIRFERNGLSSGIYLATLSNGDSDATFKMVIID